MLVVRNLNKNFADLKVLENINITANKAEIYGLVGSNGCGKTTLLKHLMNIYKQDSGEIYYCGEKVEQKSDIKNCFYYIQDNIFFPNNFTLNKLYDFEKLLYKNIDREKFNKLVEFFKIDANKNLNKMSKGQRKQAAFVMAISTNPKVLLLDEIVDGLDAVVKRKFWNVLIKEVMDNEMITIISSHDLKELDNICDKVAIMHDGKIVKEENLDALKDEVKRVQFAVEGEFNQINNDLYKIIRLIKIGSVNICTLTGDVEKFKGDLNSKYKVILFDELPMNLEEIFIAELGEHGYGTEDIEF